MRASTKVIHKLKHCGIAIVATSVVVATLSLSDAATPARADTVSASTLTALLSERPDNTTAVYDRDLFQHWIDADSNGCDTRAEVLIAESLTDVTLGAGCSISGGEWFSTYDSATWFDPSDIDIDHVVPLADAWRSGAWAWTDTQRRDFANDLEVAYALIGVTDNVNQSKGDRDPAQWMPPEATYHCQYVIDWALIKYRWSLAVDSAEMAKLTLELSGECGATAVTLPAIALAPPDGESGIEFDPGVTRLEGASRYETAIAVSQRYAPGVPVAFVATGANFPDALSGAAAAALLGGPLLLTTPNSLPAAVALELNRLNPTAIYVLGSVRVVSQGVEDTLSGIAPVTRLSGASRYETGLSVVNEVFSSSEHVFIATGRNFPDALAATGAAGSLGAPVVLVDGTQPTVPQSVMDSLNRMGVSQVSIAGSATVVSNGIRTQLINAGYTVNRFGGASRYETTALINNAFFALGSSDTAFLATGSNFPDALAGAALAGLISAPMYITTKSCAPTAIHDSREDLGATRTVVLGRSIVVSDNAALNVECAAPPPPPPPPPPPGPPANPGDTKNCSDFATWSAAQAWYLKYFPYYGDIARLDADDDGIACEGLPGAP